MGVYEVTQGQYRAVMGKNPSYFSKTGPGKEDVQNEKSTDDFPVEKVSYRDALDFISALKKKDAGNGRTYRLPTEAEWEYACRGGPNATTKPFHFGDSLVSDQANFDGTQPYGSTRKGKYLERTEKVGNYNKPNSLGLHDMHGNVAEWCADFYDADAYKGSKKERTDPVGPLNGSWRVIRGGYWERTGSGCRSAWRGRAEPTRRESYIGFRVVAELVK
jgi:formylglycine-generating enzyme required for sulfatase activity